MEDPSLQFDEFPLEHLQNTTTTIVLLHGACSNAGEWNLVIEHFSPNYHILVPDLPRHGRARNIVPFTLSNSAQLLAKLIRSRAQGGRAHIIGFSLGAHIALEMAAHHSEVALSIFASGWRYWGQPWYTPLIPFALRYQGMIEDSLPRSWLKWVTGGADIRRSEPGSRPAELMREWITAISTQVVEAVGSIPGGVLVVAATLLGDKAQDAKLAADLLSKDSESDTRVRGVFNERLTHAWNRQDPELCANVILDWIAGRPLPEGFVDCD